MKILRRGLALVLVLLVAAGGLWIWWEMGAGSRPRTLARNQGAIVKVLESAGWVSPHLAGPKLYMVAWRDCPGCIAFQAREFSRLRAAGVDTRVIAIARPDVNGQAKSTPAERTTVAELWVNRDFGLYERWTAAPSAVWTAPGLPPADGDVARTAVIEAGRKMVADLAPLLKADGVGPGYPLLIWWDKAGRMRGCVCAMASFDAVAKELGA
jgi:hypothetical protein